LNLLFGKNRGSDEKNPEFVNSLKTMAIDRNLDFVYARFLADLNPDGKPPAPRMTRIGLIQNSIQIPTTEPFETQRQVRLLDILSFG